MGKIILLNSFIKKVENMFPAFIRNENSCFHFDSLLISHFFLIDYLNHQIITNQRKINGSK